VWDKLLTACGMKKHRRIRHGKGKAESKEGKTLLGESFLSSFSLLVKPHLMSRAVSEAGGGAASRLGMHPAPCSLLTAIAAPSSPAL